MRTLLITVLAAFAVAAFAGPTMAQPPADAKALLDQAIAAKGGVAKLSELKAAVWTTRGVNSPSGARLQGQMPGQFRLDAEREVDGKVVRTSRIINGDQGWTVRDGEATPMDPAALARAKETFYHKYADFVLLPLLAPEVKLATMGESVFEGRPVVGLRVTHPLHSEKRMYFDKVTHHLIRSETISKDPETGRDIVNELVYDDYRDVGGIKVPYKSTTKRDGEVLRSSTTASFQIMPKLDNEIFRVGGK
jgi:hypothetical protein